MTELGEDSFVAGKHEHNPDSKLEMAAGTPELNTALNENPSGKLLIARGIKSLVPKKGLDS